VGIYANLLVGIVIALVFIFPYTLSFNSESYALTVAKIYLYANGTTNLSNMSEGSVEKIGNTTLSNLSISNKSSVAPVNESNLTEIPFHSKIPQSDLEQLKESLKNKTLTNQSSANVLKLNLSLKGQE
jgi:hypothetical protein